VWNWSLTLKKERGQTVFENRVVRRTSELLWVDGENFIASSFIILTPPRILLGCTNKKD
jgi:hypothetical protein